MASDKISVSIESTDVVYDVRVNGLPLIKSKKLSPRSLQIPAYHMFKEGSNTLEVNVMGVYKNKDGDIVEEFSHKSSLYVSIVKNGNRVDAFNLSYDSDNKVLVDGNKTYTGKVAKFASDDVKVIREGEFVESDILLGRFKDESISKKKEVIVSKFETLKDFWVWREGDQIDSKDLDLLKKAYENQYQKIKLNDREGAIKPLYPMYELVAKKYNGTSLQEYLEDNNVIETFSNIRTDGGDELEISPPDFSRTTFDILDDGRLARIFPDPLVWRHGSSKIDSGLLFYKKDGAFIPFFISNDTDF